MKKLTQAEIDAITRIVTKIILGELAKRGIKVTITKPKPH